MQNFDPNWKFGCLRKEIRFFQGFPKSFFQHYFLLFWVSYLSKNDLYGLVASNQV